MDRPVDDGADANFGDAGWYIGEHFPGGDANSRNVTFIYS